jgi:hypothetical protein
MTPKSESPAPERETRTPICAGCADKKRAANVRYCCGMPFCLRCYEHHIEQEHAPDDDA